MADEKLYLYSTEDCQRYGEATVDDQDVVFPDRINGWTDVLDCRVEPYVDQSLEENCDVAVHVRKKYILIGEDQVSKEHPTGEHPAA